MNIELLKQIITEQRFLGVPTDYIPRALEEKVKGLATNREILIISGLRRCGKSTVLQRIRQENPEKDYYFNFEDERLLNFTVEDFQPLLETFMELFGIQKTLYFDEIQNVPHWEQFIRRVYEQGYKIYITGSNAAMLSVELGTKLTGRYIPLVLYPLSFYEYLNYHASHLINKFVYTGEDKALVRKYFGDYCRVGGIPEYEKHEEKAYLSALYEGIIYRDIITRYKLTHEKPIKNLAFYCASHVSKEISFNALSKIIGVSSATTVADYYHYLENSFLCFLISRYSDSLKRQVYFEKKQYMIDHALARIIGFRISEDRGRLLENMVFLELKRRGYEIYFHKEKRECDFILKEQNRISTAIQVTMSLESPLVKEREYKGLQEALESYGLTQGIIITENEEGEDSFTASHGICSIKIFPLWKWLLQGV